ncbi:MAG TPA: hypothetical protein VGB18_05700 [Candidatus Thermoplasmatota archaeon]
MMKISRKELLKDDPVLAVMYWSQYFWAACGLFGVWILTPWFPWK